MRVLEISQSTAAGYAGMLLSQLGHGVDRLDLAETDVGQDPFLHRDKQTVDALPDLSTYDALVEDVGAKGLRRLGTSYRKLCRAFEQLVIVSLSPYGQTGPYRDWAATELTVQAVGGVLHVSGYEDEPPVKLPGDTAAMIAGLHGATAAIVSVLGVASGTESPVHIDISAQDTLMQHWCRHLAQYAYGGTLTRRGLREPRSIHTQHTAMAEDGWLYLLALNIPWQDLAAFLGLGDHVNLNDEDKQPWDAMKAPFQEAVASRPRYDWFSDAAAMGWTFAPVEDPFQLMASPQMAARDAFEVRQIDGREVKMPRLPFRDLTDE